MICQRVTFSARDACTESTTVYFFLYRWLARRLNVDYHRNNEENIRTEVCTAFVNEGDDPSSRAAKYISPRRINARARNVLFQGRYSHEK